MWNNQNESCRITRKLHSMKSRNKQAEMVRVSKTTQVATPETPPIRDWHFFFPSKRLKLMATNKFVRGHHHVQQLLLDTGGLTVLGLTLYIVRVIRGTRCITELVCGAIDNVWRCGMQDTCTTWRHPILLEADSINHSTFGYLSWCYLCHTWTNFFVIFEHE